MFKHLLVNFNIQYVYFYLMPKLSIEYIIHFMHHLVIHQLSLTLKLSLKVNLVPYQKV